MSISGSFVYSPCIQLQFLESLFFTDVCNLLPVLTFVGFRSAHPDNATMEDAKMALSENNIDFSKLQDWNADRCIDFNGGEMKT